MLAMAERCPAVVANLRTAYEAEENTHRRYKAFSEKADGEGWGGIGSLFRAAARAEQIHAGNHGWILVQLGGSTEIAARPVDMGETFQNLKTALAGELYEITTMYPSFRAQARACEDAAATRTFTWALEAEKTHARLFEEAVKELETATRDSWTRGERPFFVCPVCGYTTETTNEHPWCKVCYCSSKMFEKNR